MTVYAFDMEIFKVFEHDPEKDGPLDLWSHSPLGISVAAFNDGSEETTFVYSGFGQEMGQRQAITMLDWMCEQHEQGHRFVSFNGLGFDFRLLAEVTGDWERCAKLAVNHYDIMWSFFTQLGFSIGLDNLCKTAGLGQKPEDVNGKKAPTIWQGSNPGDVLRYIAGDVSLTHKLFRRIVETGEVVWTSSKTGNLVRKKIERPRLAGLESMRPVPSTPWLKDPWPRERFTGWTRKEFWAQNAVA